MGQDRLERVACADGYRRVSIVVVDEAGGREYEVDVYARTAPQLRATDIRLGPLAEYSLQHAALYRPRGS